MVSVDERIPQGQLVGGRFTIVRFLASGAMGSVYEATGPGGARVALKVITGAGAGRAAARFAREAKLSTSVSDRHVTRVEDFGVEGDDGFLVMELLDGEDLSSAIERLGPLRPAVATRIALQAARGMESAHALGIVHRDLKPSNLFLVREGNEIVTKVCDFGVAKTLDADNPQLTATGTIIGSPLYMSPEQLVRPRDVTAASDVWGLAMTIYEALAGAPPLVHVRSFPELLAAMDKPIVPLSSVAPWVPSDLAAIIHGCLLRDVDARCPSMGALVDALTALPGAGDAILAADLTPLTADERAVIAARRSMPTRWDPADHREPLLGAKLGGKYELVERLGEGGMGAVFRALTADGSELAVKVVRRHVAGTQRDATRRFVREARVAMTVSSEHVVRVVEADTDAKLGVPYIVMEILRGRDLSHAIEDLGAIESRVACRLFVEACRGVSAAHALRIVHRDIKPANLFLSESKDGTITVKVLDFGIAKRTIDMSGLEETTAELTRTGGMLGSPFYMSPEQAKNAKDVDARTDVWSLAMSFYEALAGQRPWPALQTFGEIIYTVTTKDAPRLDEVAPWVPIALARVIQKGLAREAADRYQTVAELEAAVAPFAAEHVVATDLRAVSAEAKSLAVSQRIEAVTADAETGRKRPWAAIGTGVALSLVAGYLVVGAVRRGGDLPHPEPAAVAPASATQAPAAASATALPADPSSDPPPALTASAAASSSRMVKPTQKTGKASPDTGAAPSPGAPPATTPAPTQPPPASTALGAQKAWRD